jgi:hypothetical protein
LNVSAELQLCPCFVVTAGDVLRGVTCTNFVYPTKALFGAVPPERHVVSAGCHCCAITPTYLVHKTKQLSAIALSMRLLALISTTPFAYLQPCKTRPCEYELHVCVGCVALQVVYGADKQSWANVRSALRKGEAKDGNVVLVLERRTAPFTTPAGSIRPGAAVSSSNN